MRNIAKIENHDEALLAGAHLVSNGVECKITKETSGLSMLWVMHDDYLARGRELLEQFMTDPNKERYREAVEFARKMAQKQEEEEAAADKRAAVFNQTRSRLLNLHSAPAPLTFGLILATIASCLIMSLNPTTVELFNNWLPLTAPGEGLIQTVLSGEVWRFFTPILVQTPFMNSSGSFDILALISLVFSIMWLRDLCGLVERREGTRKLLWLILALAAFPNLLCYFVLGGSLPGPWALIYGMLGYLWLRGKLDPAYGLRLNPALLAFMLFWLFLTLSLSIPSFIFSILGLVCGALGGILRSGQWRKLLMP